MKILFVLTLVSLATIGYVKPQLTCDNDHYKCWNGQNYECCLIWDK